MRFFVFIFKEKPQGGWIARIEGKIALASREIEWYNEAGR